MRHPLIVINLELDLISVATRCSVSILDITTKTKMEFNIAAQTGQVTPTIGGISKGIFGGFVSDLNKLNKSTSKTDTSEVG